MIEQYHEFMFTICFIDGVSNFELLRERCSPIKREMYDILSHLLCYRICLVLKSLYKNYLKKAL